MALQQQLGEARQQASAQERQLGREDRAPALWLQLADARQQMLTLQHVLAAERGRFIAREQAVLRTEKGAAQLLHVT